jgi:hypothetical protein
VSRLPEEDVRGKAGAPSAELNAALRAYCADKVCGFAYSGRMAHLRSVKTVIAPTL